MMLRSGSPSWARAGRWRAQQKNMGSRPARKRRAGLKGAEKNSIVIVLVILKIFQTTAATLSSKAGGRCAVLFLSVAEQAPRPKRHSEAVFSGKKHCHEDAVISGSGFPFSILNGGLSIHVKKIKYAKCFFTEE
jgi:hypothetical protein